MSKSNRVFRCPICGKTKSIVLETASKVIVLEAETMYDRPHCDRCQILMTGLDDDARPYNEDTE